MKASIKFREDQKPLIRAKIPVKILSFPFQSGVIVGESKELSLNLSTFFNSGPSLKLCYRPNDSQNPFSLVFRTGIGHFGSPISSPFSMSAEYNFIGNQSPTFFIHFKPHFGDFSLKKSQSSSALVKKMEMKPNAIGPVVSPEDSSFESPVIKGGYFEDSRLFFGRKVGVFPVESPAVGMLEGAFSGMEIRAKTAVPLKNRAVVNFRWGLRVPPGAADEVDAVMVGKSDGGGLNLFRRFPLLVMNKIGIEHVSGDHSKDSKKGTGLNSPVNTDVTEACLSMKKELEDIQMDNGLLRNALNELRSEIAAGKMNLSVVGGVGERNGNKFSGGCGRTERRDKKLLEEDMNEELKKALMGGAGGV